MRAKPLRILLWAPVGAGDHYFGPGISALHLYSHGAGGDVVVDLAHSYVGHARCRPYRNQFCVGDLGRPGVVPHLPYIVRAVRWLKAHASQYDVIHALGEHWYTVLPVTLARPWTPPVVLKMTSHAGGALAPRSWKQGVFWQLTGASRLKHRLDAVIVLNSEAERRVLAGGLRRERVVRVPNGVSIETFQPAPVEQRGQLKRELGWPDRLTFLAVGGLMARKNQVMLVEAFGDVQRQGVECQLVIIGPERQPGYRAEIDLAVRTVAAPGTVFVLGHQTELRKYYQAADVFVLPSASEGMSNALLEAMASGLPVVVGDNAGNRELVDDGVNGAITPCTRQGLADALAAMAGSEPRRLASGLRSRERIASRYSHQAVWALHRELFERLRDGASAPVTELKR